MNDTGQTPVGFLVRGVPAPQGSKRPIGNGRMIESSKKVKPWREAVRAEAQIAMEGRPPIAGPVILFATFYLRRPASAPKSVAVPAKYPDLSKLVRSTEDGLTEAGVWEDDARVVATHSYKVFADDQHPMGAAIWVFPWRLSGEIFPPSPKVAMAVAAARTS